MRAIGLGATDDKRRKRIPRASWSASWGGAVEDGGGPVPVAAAGSGISSHAIADGQHAYYLADTQHVHQLWWNGQL